MKKVITSVVANKINEEITTHAAGLLGTAIKEAKKKKSKQEE